MTDEATVTVEEHERLKTQLQNWQAKATDYEKKYGGVDIEALKAKAEERDLLLKDRAKGNPDEVEGLLKKTREEALLEASNRFSGKLTEFETELGSTKTELKRLRVTNVAMNEAASIFNSDALELIQARVEADCDYQDGEIVIKGADGKALASKLDPRKQMDVKEYLQGLAGKYPSTAKSTIEPGSKSQGEKKSSVLTGEVSVEKYAAMTEEQRAALPRDVQGKLSQQYFRNK